MSLKLSLFRFLGEHRCRSNSGSELLWRSRIGRDLAPALHEIRWKSLTDRIDREVRLGTLPQPPAMSFSAALMSAAPHPPGVQVKGMPAASGGGQLFAIWGGTMAQTCRAHCHPGGRRDRWGGCRSRSDPFAGRRHNALKIRRFSRLLMLPSLRVFLDFANYCSANIINRSTSCCALATIKATARQLVSPAHNSSAAATRAATTASGDPSRMVRV
jgi:hypothetical protein